MKNTPLRIEVFTDFVCPWCYLATAVVARLQEQYTLDIQWLPYPLHPETPMEGMPLSDLLPGVNLDTAHQRLHGLMDELGLEHGKRDNTYNSRLAQELAMWAATQPGGAALAPLIYRAYFVHNRNLADVSVLLELVAEAGLDVEAATEALGEHSFSDAVDQSWSLARQYQISGVPTFIAGGYQVTGFQALAELQRFIEFVQEKQDSA